MFLVVVGFEGLTESEHFPKEDGKRKYVSRFPIVFTQDYLWSHYLNRIENWSENYV
jgi:hypothetical protein